MFTKVAGCAAFLRRTRTALRHLPPCSPDLNLIENACSTFKVILRRTATSIIDSRQDAIRDALPRFTPNDCARDFTTAGQKPDQSERAPRTRFTDWAWTL